jgi:membrane protein YdbS with pleckstrin-like domain
MAQPAQEFNREIWRGRPWVLPYVAVRTIVIVVFAAVVITLETYLYGLTIGSTLMIGTIIVLLVLWILWIANLLVVRSTNLYILRADSLEIKTGILTTKNSVILPTGFSDLEIIRTVTSRIFNTGNINIKTQSEKDYTKKLVMVKDPMRIAGLIRDVMARQIFKLDK